MKGAIAIFLLVLATSYVMFEPCHAVTCGDVAKNLEPCRGFLTGKGGKTEPCCNGVNTLKGLVHSSADKRTTCYCMKTQASQVKGFRYDLINALPRQCGVNLGFNIDLNKCDKI